MRWEWTIRAIDGGLIFYFIGFCLCKCFEGTVKHFDNTNVSTDIVAEVEALIAETKINFILLVVGS